MAVDTQRAAAVQEAHLARLAVATSCGRQVDETTVGAPGSKCSRPLRGPACPRIRHCLDAAPARRTS